MCETFQQDWRHQIFENFDLKNLKKDQKLNSPILLQVLSSWPFDPHRIGSVVLSYFPSIFLCVNLLRQGAKMDLQHQKMNLLHSSTVWTSSIYSFFALKKLKKPPSKVAQKYSKKFSPIAAKTVQTEEFLFQNVAYRSTVYNTGPF